MNNGSLCSELSCRKDVCGSSVSPSAVSLEPASSNLVYMDKVFSLNEGTSCPLMHNLCIDSTQLTNININAPRRNCCEDNCGCDCGCNCGCNCNCCCDFQIGSNTSFTVNESKVIVKSVELPCGVVICPEDITINGLPVNRVTQVNGEFVVDISNIIDEIVKCKCIERGLPSQALFLAHNIGTWKLDLTIVLEGVVTNGSQSCCFTICFDTPVECPLEVLDTSTFAIPRVNIPCSTNGNTPTITFAFDACATLLNPIIGVIEKVGVNCPSHTLALTGTLIVEPTISLRVTRPTLFSVNAAENCHCCDEAVNCCSCDNRLEIDCSNNTCCGQDTSCCQCNNTNGYSW